MVNEHIESDLAAIVNITKKAISILAAKNETLPAPADRADEIEALREKLIAEFNSSIMQLSHSYRKKEMRELTQKENELIWQITYWIHRLIKLTKLSRFPGLALIHLQALAIKG